MPQAITNQIKTYYTLYAGAETGGELPQTPEMNPMRYSDCSLEGTAEELTSDVIIPDSRIPSTPEKGSESSAGDLSTEWNIDEQDSFFEAVFCNTWQVQEDPSVTSKKVLTLGDTKHSFSLLKKYPQTPVLYQLFTKVFVNQLTMTFNTDDFVKLDWNLMGSNNPLKETTDPLASKTPTYNTALTTKSFITTDGFLKVGDSTETLSALRHSPSLDITINNNMERTPALCEKESIENSLGDFVVSGNLGVYDVDDSGKEIYNKAVNGVDQIIQISVERTVGTTSTSYTLTMPVHLSAPTESKNGNKLQFGVPFTVNKADDLKLEKVVKEIA